MREFNRRPLAYAALACCAGLCLPVKAFQFDAPEDWQIRWDNTFKVSTKYRLQDADPALSQSFYNDDPVNGGPRALNWNAGNQNFQNKGIFSERLDILSEFDAVWQRNFGVRLSAAGWYDHKIRGTTDATDPFTSQTPYNEFPEQTRRRAGRKAELLDAFVFGGWRLGGESKLTARLGRHALQYGESLFFGDNGIARAQGPIDIDKLLAAPGAQFKEIIRPVPQISTMLQVNQDVSIGGYYQFRWEEDRLPAPGTYFSTVNFPWSTYQPEFASIRDQNGVRQNYFLLPGGDRKPKDSGQFGLQGKWRLGETDLGIYYARYHDKGGQIYSQFDPSGTPNAFGQLSGQRYFVFPQGIRTWGVSATHSLGDVNFSAEGSIRQNMPLRSTNMFYPAGVPEPQYATGKTAHVNFSWLASIGPNFVAQEISFLGELAWNRVLSKNDPQAQLDSGRTRDATAVRMILSPTYRQVMPGLDINVPVGLGYTLQGNSAVTAWGAKNSGDLSVGLEGNYLGVWQMGLTYTHYIGKAIPFVDFATLAYGLGNPLADRDFIALSLRRTF